MAKFHIGEEKKKKPSQNFLKYDISDPQAVQV